MSPSDRYDDYLNRTSTSRGPIHVSSDAAPMEASLPDGGFNAKYIATCLPHILPVTAPLRFAVDLTYAPNASSPGGTISLGYTPLKVSATSINDTVGDTISGSSPVDTNGNFTLHLENILIPGQAVANGSNVVFAMDTPELGLFTNEDTICAGLDGHVLSPDDFMLDHCVDICLFVRIATPDMALPTYSDRNQFVCPLPGC